jgi:uncharacterized protein involved in propanediol utilization
MKISRIEHQQMVEAQRVYTQNLQKEEHYKKVLDDRKQLCKVQDIVDQTRRIERNKRLGKIKGQNVDVDC